MRNVRFLLLALAVAVAAFAAARLVNNAYVFFAGYVVLQYIVLATAWNILGGYTGYVNFGTAAFFALGAYTTVVLHKTIPLLPLPVMMLVGGVVSGRHWSRHGVFDPAFARHVLLDRDVGDGRCRANTDNQLELRRRIARRLHHSARQFADLPRRLHPIPVRGDAAVVCAFRCLARAIQHSRLGYGFSAIRDDELAAEASGVPTLRLKLIATTLSGGLMGMAGAPLPYYVTYLDPASGFSLSYAVNTIAMPLIGGTATWLGPVIGAILLGTLQQVATVTISSALSLLLVGLLLVAFVIAAPRGIVGWFSR